MKACFPASFLGILLILQLAACHGQVSSFSEKTAETATLHGTVSYHGHGESQKGSDWCGHKQEAVLKVGEKGQLAEALITIGSKELSELPTALAAKAVPPGGRVKVDECAFAPAYLVLADGGSLLLTNEDKAASHNIYLIYNKAIVNQVTLAPATDSSFTLQKTGFYQLGELRHGEWLYVTIYVAAEPLYAISDAEGHYSFNGLPPGNYDLHIRHQILGEIAKVVNLTPGENEGQYSVF